MKRWLPFVVLACVVLVGALVFAQGLDTTLSFEIKPGKTFKQPVPKVNFSPAQVQKIKAQKPVCLLLPSPSDPELKAGYMATVMNIDPVTVWWITQDIAHFHLVDPAYPSSGSLTNRRRSFMPYVFDGAVCSVGNHSYLYQLLVMPLVEPRVYTLSRYHNRDGFTWESAWTAASDLYCSDHRNAEMESFFRSAVKITHNNGCWHIQPVPEAFRTKPEDVLLAYVEYYVDTNPGGNLASIKPIVNKATETAMPALHKNLLFHAANWETHLKKYHSAADQQRYHSELAAFRQAMGH
jgi:hypothetical protein